MAKSRAKAEEEEKKKLKKEKIMEVRLWDSGFLCL